MGNLENIKAWPGSRLPISGAWALKHDLNWWYAQILAGHHILPTIKLPVASLMNVPKVALELEAFKTVLQFISDSEFPIVLRHQSQISMDMASYHGTGPNETAASTWRINKLGVLDFGAVCDFFAPETLWSSHEALIANSLYVRRLQELCPNPGRILLLDNNEKFYPSPKVYSAPTKIPHFRAWLSRETLQGLSLRMVEHVDSVGYDSNACDSLPLLQSLRDDQYASLYDAFTNGLDEWEEKPFLTGAYSAGADLGLDPPPEIVQQIGYAFEGTSYNFTGPASYLSGAADASIFSRNHSLDIERNIPSWAWLEEKNHDNGSMVFLNVENRASMLPALAGIHEVTDPSLFTAFCEWQAWISRANLLEHWTSNTNGPTDLFYHDKDPETTLELQEMLISLGRTDLLGVTHQEHTLAPSIACGSICEPGKVEFWLDGEQVAASSSDPRVMVACFKIGERRLAFSMTPCHIDTPIVITTDIGDVTIHFRGRHSLYVTAGFQWVEL